MKKPWKNFRFQSFHCFRFLPQKYGKSACRARERQDMEGKRNGILSKRQNRPRENRADGRKGGDGRKYANLAGLRERRMKAGNRIFATLCRLTSDAVRTDTAPASAKREKKLAKRQSGFARGKPPIRKKNPPEAPFFLAFHTPGNVFAARNFRLCGKKEISFRKEILFLPHKNRAKSGEMFHTDSSATRFLTLRGLFPPCRPAARIRNLSENLPF